MDNVYECPLCGGEIEYNGDFDPEYPKTYLEGLPDYLSLFHRCKSCGSFFESLYGLNRVE